MASVLKEFNLIIKDYNYLIGKYTLNQNMLHYSLNTVYNNSVSDLLSAHCSIQFNSKTLFKDGDPVSLKLSSLGPSKHVNKYNNYSYIYTKQHRFIGQSQANTTYTFIQNINTHT